MLLRSLSLFGVLVLAATGCSSNKLSGMQNPDLAQLLDMTALPDLQLPSRDPTDHPDLPQVQNNGGPVMSAPKVWTVVWPGDEALGQKVNTFVGATLASDYWTTSLVEYGVGAGSALGVYVMPSAPPATLDDKTLTSTMIKAVVAALPTPVDNNTIISFIIPTKTTSTSHGQTGCNEYGGYHSSTRAATGSTQNVSYAVNLQCADPTLSPFDALTDVLSHELAEASTDPLPQSSPAWANYTVAAGGEIADLCVFLDTHITVSVNDGDAGSTQETYNVQRLYSQKLAAAEKADPCLPAPTTPYFNVALNPSDIDIKLGTATTGTGTLVLEPYAYGSVGEITWQIYGYEGSGITVTPTKGTLQAGQTFQVAVQATTAAKQNLGGQPLAIFVEAQTDDGTINEWFGSISVE